MLETKGVNNLQINMRIGSLNINKVSKELDFVSASDGTEYS
jgi:preprotein translocase subunit SecD